ncbi:MAG: restriction endonuclease subunit S [Pseudomonadota bacterium]
MSYAPYPAYKDSGVPWLGNIPEHWDWAKLYLLSKRYAGGTPDKNVPEYWEDGTIPWLNSGSVNQFNIDTPSAFITEDAYKNSSAKWVPEGALLMALAGQGKTKGMVAQTTFDTTCNQSMAAIVWRKANPRFMLWWLNSQYLNIRGLASSDARDGLNLEMLARIPCPLPSKEEQITIADFLDKKTAEIDDLIAKKEELLLLLAEQRTALITLAVTKGLNPNAQMKPSGIDWLGDVPEGWEVKPFKREVWYQEGPGIMAVDFRDEGVPLLRIRNLKPGKVELEGCNYLDPDMANGKWAHFQVEEGDRLISTSASTGLVSVVDADAAGAIPYTGIIRIRPLTASLLPEFLEYFVSSELFFDQIELLATGTTIQHFGPYHLNQMVMAVPPVQEQGRLIETLASDLAKISETKGMVEIALDRLKEYRTALITNAVTGKIKVV